MRTLLIATLTFFALNGCTGWNFEPADKPPANEYEKRIYQQQDALEQQRETMLNAYHT